MPHPTALIHPSPLPANACPHLRLRICVTGRLVPYVRPVVVLTNRAGARL